MLKALNFTQSTPASTWTVTHNFGSKPIVDVFAVVGGTKQKIYPQSIVHTSDNVLTITFSTNMTGGARLVGEAPDILRSPTDSYYPADNV
jgi:hypothetical protein